MKVFVNQEVFSVDPDTSLAQFLIRQNFNQEGIAIAINSAVIPKEEWGKTRLNNNDQLMIIQATAGG